MISTCVPEIERVKEELSHLLLNKHLDRDVLNSVSSVLRSVRSEEDLKIIAKHIANNINDRAKGVAGDPIGGTDSQAIAIDILIDCIEIL